MSPDGLGLQSTHSHIPAVCAPVPCTIYTQSHSSSLCTCALYNLHTFTFQQFVHLCPVQSAYNFHNYQQIF